MSVLKVIEILGNVTKRFEDAMRNVLEETSKTVTDIKWLYVQDMQGSVKDIAISEYRVNTKMTFGII